MIATDILHLPNRFFQPALSGRSDGHPEGLANDRLGQLVVDAADIEQCIRIILSTPRGSDPHRPLFGSELHLYLDHPVNSARPHIVREAVNALREWEPRIAVLKVSVDLIELAQLQCSVQWQLAGSLDGERQLTHLALGGAA
ncbi:hypothetical protein G5B88_01050 [Herbaspirillum seropedicae]|uniref:Bacteriophage baseplate assembly protein W n=1 Tax=Herbaspirillum seropedicae (strain SmR1) TaxID=757424 RepID=D8IV19_HERSS|nr:GPW/gp25 family protein [Herbaspirillum seropedicae]ADJ61738.1 bacteriophage baseplate assembly protein W [Herbaspirillum seropedicae SmR1]NQE29313.1 hypothetical protein [Herbaspirillum seropedicae]UMU19852.1 hypothetical protein G5B88_01050 [Herbaspirillum seropedicae]